MLWRSKSRSDPVVLMPYPAKSFRDAVRTGKLGPMTVVSGSKMAQLKDEVRRWALKDGVNATPLGGLRIYRSESPFPFRRSASGCFALAVVVQGRKVAKVQGSQLSYGPSQYLVLSRAMECESRVVEASPQKPYMSLYLKLPPRLLARTLIDLADADLDRGEQPPAAQAFVNSLDEELADALVRLLKALARPSQAEALAPLQLQEIIFRLLESDSAAFLRREAAAAGHDQQIWKAIEYIRRNMASRLTVEEIAGHVGMSPSHFAHIFRDVTRTSPIQYAKDVRLNQARLLLIAEGARVGEAAQQVGYASPSHFTRDFTDQYGLPPGRYAKRFRTH